ncbi:MAG: hypothetical protein GWP19_08135 [Planctomycetia bacterium]|nr:hypothetical protein [Planctomycetia bacterium]
MLRRLDVPEEEILTIEKDENIPILMKAKELIKKLGTTELFEKNENGTYKVYAKITALSLMSASIGMMTDLGVGMSATPYYAGVSRWLNVPKDTLRRWWANQNLIMREKISLGSAAAQRMILKQLEIAELYTDGLKITLKEMKELKKTPKGIATMQKVAAGALFQAKFLADQSGVITEEKQLKTVEKGTGMKHGVTILMPVETKEPVKKYKKEKDGNDITDRE